MAIRVIIADDHPIVLDGLALLFGAESDVDVVSRCTTCEDALSSVRRAKPDVLVLDVRMPGGGGMEVLRTLHAEQHPTRVVLLTAQISDAEVMDAVRLGVGGIVLKETAPRALLQCVRTVAAGEPWLDQRTMHSALEKLLRREAGLEKASRQLTRRELDIARMVALGARNKEIADKLGISEGTVKMHLHTVYEKLSISGRVALSIYARDHSLV
jgi:DNA-binding NarL/FixJ family response regulator